MVYRFIDDNKKSYGLRWLCSHLNISTNCYYNYLKGKKNNYRTELDKILERIKYIYYNNNRVIGHRPMMIFLKRYGYKLSKTTVHKYMNKMLNLGAVIMRKNRGYKTGQKHKIFNNLVKQKFIVTEKNKIWCTDFTYMRDPNGKFRYNCTIIDLFDRSVVASVNGPSINSRMATDTLRKALIKENNPKGIILHSDQGSQYSSWEFVIFCRKHGVTQSMSKAGCPYDNAPMERYFNTFKSNFYYQNKFESVKAMDEATDRYVNYYNYIRPHSYNGYLTPMEARAK